VKKAKTRSGTCWIPANQLRNTIAHSLSMDKIEAKMATLKEKYLGVLTEKQAAGIRDQPDEFIAMSACSACAGFLATLESRIKADATAQQA
jgi:hypothetical protein